MPVDLADLTEKVRDQIAGLFSQTGPASLGAPVLAFEPLGIPVPTSSFHAQPTDAGPVPALAKRRVSILANQVPALHNGIYNRTDFQIDEFYQFLINSLQPSPGAEADAGPLFAILAHAKQLYHEGDILDVLNAADTIYPTEAEPADWYLPGAPDSWTAFRFSTAPPPRILFDSTAGTATIRGTFSFDFERGVESPDGDVFWQQSTAAVRAMVPKGAARLADLGAVSFDDLGPPELTAAPFSTAPISGSDDAGDRLQVGRVFAVRTNGGRHAKVQVVSRHQEPNSFYMIRVRWVTYVPVSVPTATGGAAAPRTMMIRTLDGAAAPALATKPKWAWTLGATPVIPTARPLSGRIAATVPTVRASRLRDLMVARPAMAFARVPRVDAAAPAEAQSLELDFELRAVTLHRPWMSLGMLADRRWFIPGYRAGEFGSKVLPAFPTTMLVARNVVVKMTGSPDDSPLRAVGFGPFSLANRTASTLPSVPGQFGATLSAPTPQIIGWLAQPLAGIAPAADPALPPE